MKNQRIGKGVVIVPTDPNRTWIFRPFIFDSVGLTLQQAVEDLAGQGLRALAYIHGDGGVNVLVAKN